MPRLGKRAMAAWLQDPTGTSNEMIAETYDSRRLPYNIHTQPKTYGTVATLHGDRYYQEYTP